MYAVRVLLLSGARRKPSQALTDAILARTECHVNSFWGLTVKSAGAIILSNSSVNQQRAELPSPSAMCDSRWSSQQWRSFSVEEYPSVEALQEHMKRLETMNWWRYLEITTILGTARES